MNTIAAISGAIAVLGTLVLLIIRKHQSPEARMRRRRDRANQAVREAEEHAHDGEGDKLRDKFMRPGD